MNVTSAPEGTRTGELRIELMEQIPPSELKRNKASALDKLLLLLWVFSYAVILQVFRAAARLERGR